MPAGRPSAYTDEIAACICARLAEGESLRKICEDKDMPSREAVRLWLGQNDKFLGQYTRAREEQADHYFDEIVEISDTDEDSQRARVRIDARKWVAGKLRPKKYGDRIVNEHMGPDGGPVVIERVERVIVDSPRQDAQD